LLFESNDLFSWFHDKISAISQENSLGKSWQVSLIMEVCGIELQKLLEMHINIAQQNVSIPKDATSIVAIVLFHSKLVL
jgi:hypothetical protein